MARFPPRVLWNYLLGGSLASKECVRITGAGSAARNYTATRTIRQEAQPQSHASSPPVEPFRKQLKDVAKARKASGLPRRNKKSSQEHHPEWELTVGIEIHAQLNTPRKLFSSAASSINADPNTHVALFDLAIPGSQPIFQPEVLIPALRAALALNCDIQRVSKFDRKHYFHWDQPAGYQITQYYEPFAKDGYITLYRHDGIAEDDLKEGQDELKVRIKQVQMEQDTAKTTAQLDSHLLDFNRVGLPLVEIITMPEIHSPSTAAALVRKIQTLLSSVDACVLGMESGGLRADVNVSVRRKTDDDAMHRYGDVGGLGQRTEIKNLSSFKAVKDAVIAERDRQIGVLEGGGVIEGETRGWTIGSTETRRLRGKEGEVDYRYMPDPDISPLVIGEDLIQALRNTIGILPDTEVKSLTADYGLTTKDAFSLVSLDNGGRVEYFYKVVEELQQLEPGDMNEHGRICGNWVLHELGGLVGESTEDNILQIDLDGNCILAASDMARIIHYLSQNKITGNTAKLLLSDLLTASIAGHAISVEEMIVDGNLWFQPLSDEDYDKLAGSVMDDKVVEQILKGQKGKIMFLVGQMMRRGPDGRVEPKIAEKVLVEMIERRRKQWS